MYVNTKELIISSYKPATVEGRINYKVVSSGKHKGSFKEYWFKLTGNLLFYFNLNNFGGIKGNEPAGVIVLENFTVLPDEEGIGLFSFVIIFGGDLDKHVFSCFNATQAQNWVVALRQASFEHWRLQVMILESKLESLGGKTISSWNKSARNVPARSAPPPPMADKSVGPPSSTFKSHLATGTAATNANQDLISW